MLKTRPFSRRIFLNCPYDKAYEPILRSVLFTIAYLGYQPCLASMSIDSGSPRIGQILKLITSCKYGIHDLSRLRASRQGEFYRLNMSYELGLDIGCRIFKRGRHSHKRCLILEEKSYRYQKALSDMSGSDILAHGGQPIRAVEQVCEWLGPSRKKHELGPQGIWFKFNEFTSYLYDTLTENGYSRKQIDRLKPSTFLRHLNEWIENASAY